jgi:hypothetical protein
VHSETMVVTGNETSGCAKPLLNAIDTVPVGLCIAECERLQPDESHNVAYKKLINVSTAGERVGPQPTSFKPSPLRTVVAG